MQCFCQNTFISYFFIYRILKNFIHQIINPTSNYPLQCNSKKYLKNLWREISIYFQTTMCNQKIAPKKNKKRQFMSVDKNNNFLSRGKERPTSIYFSSHSFTIMIWSFSDYSMQKILFIEFIILCRQFCHKRWSLNS